MHSLCLLGRIHCDTEYTATQPCKQKKKYPMNIIPGMHLRSCDIKLIEVIWAGLEKFPFSIADFPYVFLYFSPQNQTKFPGKELPFFHVFSSSASYELPLQMHSLLDWNQVQNILNWNVTMVNLFGAGTTFNPPPKKRGSGTMQLKCTKKCTLIFEKFWPYFIYLLVIHN